MNKDEFRGRVYGKFKSSLVTRWDRTSCYWSCRFRCLSVCQLTVELVSEGVQQMRYGFLHADVSLQLGAQRRHTFTFDAARYNVSEPRQVRVTVQSDAVRRDVPTAVDPWKTHSKFIFGLYLPNRNPNKLNTQILKVQCLLFFKKEVQIHFWGGLAVCEVKWKQTNIFSLQWHEGVD